MVVFLTRLLNPAALIEICAAQKIFFDDFLGFLHILRRRLIFYVQRENTKQSWHYLVTFYFSVQ